MSTTMAPAPDPGSAVGGAAKPSPEQVIQFVERLLEVTKLERYAYLVVSSLAAAILLVSAGVLLRKGGGDLPTLLGLFGSTGVVTVTTTQILRVWSDAIKIVIPR